MAAPLVSSRSPRAPLVLTVKIPTRNMALPLSHKNVPCLRFYCRTADRIPASSWQSSNRLPSLYHMGYMVSDFLSSRKEYAIIAVVAKHLLHAQRGKRSWTGETDQ